MAVAAAGRLREAPKVEPAFESIVDHRAGPVRTFALRDDRGTLHTMDEWSGRRAIVLLFCKFAQRESVRSGPRDGEARRASSRRAEFCFSRFAASRLSASREHDASRLNSTVHFRSCSILARVVARQAGVRAVPEAVVLAPDGQVLYRGRVSPGPAAPGVVQTPAASHDLESALRSIDRDELPAVFVDPRRWQPTSHRFVSGGRWA